MVTSEGTVVGGGAVVAGGGLLRSGAHAELCALAELLGMPVMTDTVMAGRYSAVDLAGVALGASIWIPIYMLIFE